MQKSILSYNISIPSRQLKFHAHARVHAPRKGQGAQTAVVLARQREDRVALIARVVLQLNRVKIR